MDRSRLEESDADPSDLHGGMLATGPPATDLGSEETRRSVAVRLDEERTLSRGAQDIVTPGCCQPLFDAYMFIDWSARNRPVTGTDSIWIGEASWHEGRLRVSEPLNPSTRHAAAGELLQRLQSHVREQRRVLVGFDFAYGYPYGFWHLLGGGRDKADWLGVWETLDMAVVDTPQNLSNRFITASDLNALCGHPPGPYWGCPKQACRRFRDCDGSDDGRCLTPDLRPTQTGHLDGYRRLPAWRLTEQQLRGPQSTWKLSGRGSVGSQVLTGIPRLYQLRYHQALSDHSSVWPFETGWQVPHRRPLVLYAEIWPSAVPLEAELDDVKDAAQVLTMLRTAAHQDAAGALALRFAQPQGLVGEQETQVLSAEGWILWTDVQSTPQHRSAQDEYAEERHVDTAREENAVFDAQLDLDNSSWVYFANPEGVGLQQTLYLAQQGWLWRSVHNRAGAAIANVGNLRPGQRIFLYYSHNGLIDLLASGTIGNPAELQMEPVGETVKGTAVPAIGFWNGAEEVVHGYPRDPRLLRWTGICIVPDEKPVSPGHVVRPVGNNAIWRLVDCRRRGG